MDWLVSFRKAIDYMEEHLLEDIGANEVADVVHISAFYFQRSFKIVTGYSIGEYMRNRRLYLAGLDVLKKADRECRQPLDEKIIDLAYKYGYDTPESFTKAFSRFHGLSPMQLRAQPHRIKVFLPLIIEISIRGGNKMEFTIEKREAMRMIGFDRMFFYDSSYQEIPKFWKEFCERYCGSGAAAEPVDEDVRQTIAECMVGEYGICVENPADENQFQYFIAGAYQGGKVPAGMKVLDIPAGEWAKFKCKGAMPDALQAVNTRVFSEWLPGNPEFETAFHMNIEWYSCGDTKSGDYESAIWIPVRRL
ncbi:MAG: AraC family transcriptional regulator [Lachnospiraceae bacterium]|nr:AraC family transcriptional regulator [Lachnospiraceae bacterium]